jgi:hypothetical protein
MLTSSTNRGDGHTQRTIRRPENARQTPWNKGKLIGSKRPLRTKDGLSTLTKLQVQERTRDSAMFNLAIHRKLPGGDGVSLKVEDVARMA